MKKIASLFKNKYVRLAGRALVAAAGVVVSKYVSGDHATQALIVAFLVGFAEVFTPLNSLVGLFKQAAPPVPGA